jgi:hypothetical protein
VQRHRDAFAGHLVGDGAQVGAHQRQQRGIDGGGGGANVFAELGHHARRQRHDGAWQLLGQDLAHTPFVVVVDEREQQHHRHRLDAAGT